jgi:diguanylate cyclase (GGDEF)-like protein
MHSNYAVLDKYLDILSGSPDFFAYVGATTHGSIYSLVDSDYFHSVRIAHNEVLEQKAERRLFIKLNSVKSGMKDCYIVMKPYKDGKDGYVYVEIYEMDGLLSRYGALTRHTAVLHSVSLLKHIIMFEYSIGIDDMYMYICNEGQVYELYRGTLGELRHKLTEDHGIAPESVAEFNTLMDNMEKHSHSISAEISADLFNKGEYVDYSVRAELININNEPEVIGGTISTKTEGGDGSLLQAFDKDSMTGVLNKNAIISYTKDRLRMRDKQNVSLAILDLDNFKQVNDVLGHAVGDKVILKFVDIIKAAVGTAGAVGRFGGDEFMVVIDDLKDVDELRQYFRAIRSNTELALKNLAPGLSATCSIGITEVNRLEGDITYDNLFKTTDICLYIAKEFGKNRYVMYDDRTKDYIGESTTLPQLHSYRFNLTTDFNLRMTNDLFTRRAEAIPDVIKEIGESLSLKNINIFYGEDMKLIYHWGTENTDGINADYVFEDDYVKHFNDNHIFCLMSAKTLEMKMPDAFKKLKAQNIYSAMQYIMLDGDKPVGLVSFELPHPGRYWHQSEMNSFIMISPLIAQILQMEFGN